MKKQIKVRGILGHLQNCVLKFLLNYGVGDDNEINQNEGHSNESSKKIKYGEGNNGEMNQIEGHSGTSTEIYFEISSKSLGS